MAYELKELSVGGILDTSIRLLKDNFGLIFGIVAIGYLPAAFLATLAQLAFAPKPPGQPQTQQEMQAFAQEYAASMMILGPIILLFILIVIPLTNAAVTDAIAKLYLGQPVSMGSSFAKGLKWLLPLGVTWFLYVLVAALGLMLCIIPGLVFMFWFGLIIQVVMIEGVWGTTALSRSKAIVKGNIGKFFVLGLVAGLINLAGNIVPNLIPQIYVHAAVSAVISSILFALLSAIWVVFYFSCRCANENFDLQMLAESVARSETQDRI